MPPKKKGGKKADEWFVCTFPGHIVNGCHVRYIIMFYFRDDEAAERKLAALSLSKETVAEPTAEVFFTMDPTQFLLSFLGQTSWWRWIQKGRFRRSVSFGRIW